MQKQPRFLKKPGCYVLKKAEAYVTDQKVIINENRWVFSNRPKSV